MREHPQTTLKSMFDDGVIRNTSDKHIDIINYLLDHSSNPSKTLAGASE